METDPSIEQTAQLRPRFAPASGAPRRAILDPARKRDLAIRRGRVDPHKVEARCRHRFRHHVAGPIVSVKDSDVAEGTPGLGGKRRRDNLGHGVRRLALQAIIALDEGDHRLAIRVIRLVAARLPQRHFRSADNPRGRAIVELELYALDVLALGQFLQQRPVGARKAVNRLIRVANREETNTAVEGHALDDPVQRHAEILIFIHRQDREFRLKQRKHPIMLRHQALAEDHEVVEVNETRAPQLGLVALRPGRKLLFAGPGLRRPVEDRPAMTPKVHRLVGMAHAEKPVANPLHRLIGLPLRGDGKRKRHRQIRKPTIGHQQMSQAETMDGADEKVRRFPQAQPFQPARQFARAFLAVGDACRATGCAHVLGHDPSKFEHQRFGLAAPRPGEHDAMAHRIVGRLLTRIASQIARVGQIGGADTTQGHREYAPAPAGCKPDTYHRRRAALAPARSVLFQCVR